MLITAVVAIGAASLSLWVWSQDRVDSETRTRVAHQASAPRGEPAPSPQEEAVWTAPDVGMPPHASAPSEDEETIDGDAPPPAPGSEEHLRGLDEMTQSLEENLRTLDERIAEAEAAPDSESDPELARLRELRDKFTSDLELRRWAASIDRARAEGRDIPPPPPALGPPSLDG